MKNAYFLKWAAGSLLLLLTGSSTLFAQDFAWAVHMGGPQWDDGQDIVVDDSGNVYSIGMFEGTGADFDPGAGTCLFNNTGPVNSGKRDIYISKLDANGNFVWAKHLPAVSMNTMYYHPAITLDAGGNIYCTGAFRGSVDFDPGPATSTLTASTIADVFVLKLTAAGNFVWVKQISGMSWQITSGIVVDHAHNIYISGSFMGITDFDPGAATYTLSSNSNVESAAFLCKLNADGNFVWAKQMGGTGLDFAGGMSKDDIGNIYLCGIFDGTEDFDPNAGTVTLSTTASSCAFIVKFNSSGNLIWARQTQDVSGSSNSIQGWDIAVDHSGGAYLTGSFAGTFDLDPGAATHTISSGPGSQVYGLKLDSAGNYVWGIAITGTGVSPNSGMSVALDDDGDAYIGGQYNGTVDFDPGTGVHNLTTVMPGYTQSFIVKLSSDSGSFVWVKEFADGNSYVRSLYVEGSEEIIYVTGQLNDVPVDFDPGTGVHTVTSAAWSDAFVCKLGWSVLGNEEQIMLGSDLAVYPNPASNVINIRSLKEITGVDIYDLQGKKLIAGNGNIQSVNISGLSAGTYLVAVRHAEKTRVTKLIVTE